MTNRRVLARRAFALAAAVSGAFVLHSGRAQEAANQPALTEIIVTAQKREQNIQDVPISVIALSAQQLKDSGVTDIKDMTALTPGLTVTSTTDENSTTARIRGIGTVGDNPGLESSVGVVIDGVYRPRNGVGFGNLGEIEQIEVLEGPQGELFGKNNDAGVINITTKRPSTTFGATAEITAGNFNDREVSASVTGPVGSISAARLYVSYQRRDGWLDVDTGPGPNTDDRSNNRNEFTMRGQFLVTPSDDLDVLFIGDYSKRNEVCCDAVATDLGPFAGVANAIAGVPAWAVRPAPSALRRDAATKRIRTIRGDSRSATWESPLSSIGIWASRNSPRSPRGATIRSTPATTPTIRRSIFCTSPTPPPI